MRCKDNIKSAINQDYCRYEAILRGDFDPDYEAYLWIGDDGHGRNGAPYHIKDIVSDMEEAEEQIYELLQALEVEFICNSQELF